MLDKFHDCRENSGQRCGQCRHGSVNEFRDQSDYRFQYLRKKIRNAGYHVENRLQQNRSGGQNGIRNAGERIRQCRNNPVHQVWNGGYNGRCNPENGIGQRRKIVQNRFRHGSDEVQNSIYHLRQCRNDCPEDGGQDGRNLIHQGGETVYHQFQNRSEQASDERQKCRNILFNRCENVRYQSGDIFGHNTDIAVCP